MPTTDVTVRLRTKAVAPVASSIRRMIVVMMDANHISECLASRKNEMSELSLTNALCSNRKGYTLLEKSASGLRYRRLVEIELELADLMKRCA
jgi:hypothetical protein